MLGSISYIAYPGTGQERVVQGPGFDSMEQAAADNRKLYNIFLKVQQHTEKKLKEPESSVGRGNVPAR